jgi:hypothetical protein
MALFFLRLGNLVIIRFESRRVLETFRLGITPVDQDRGEYSTLHVPRYHFGFHSPGSAAH